MSIYKKELKRMLGPWCMWTLAFVFIQSFVCIFLFPEVRTQISVVNDAMENGEKFVSALGMDHLELDRITDLYGMVCSMVLGIGGGLFAAVNGAYILEVEEEGYTADFLFTHPVSRTGVLMQKLSSLFTQVIALNAVMVGTGSVIARIMDETLEMHSFILLHIAYLAMQLEIASICFGISAFIRKGGIGIGVALVSVLYLVDIIYNISERADFLRYMTPYAYCGVGRILSQSGISLELIGIGIAVGLAGIIAGCLKYVRKDIYVVD